MGDSQKIVRAFRDGELIETWFGDTKSAEGIELVEEMPKYLTGREYYVDRILEILSTWYDGQLSNDAAKQIYDELIAPLLEEDRG